MKFWYAFLLCLVLGAPLFAQVDTTQVEPPRLIQLLSAQALEQNVFGGKEKVRLVTRDSLKQVKFKQKNTIMFCDSAFQYIAENKIVAKGNIRFIENDSVNLTGDTLYYDGNTRLAQLRGNVILDDGHILVKTDHMDYHLPSKQASYFNGGTVEDDSTNLSSDRAYYNTETKLSSFRGNVRIRDKEGTDIQADSLDYDTNTKIAVVQSQTRIKTRDGEIIAEQGSEFNTLLGTSKIKGKEGEQLRVENTEYIIEADFFDYDNITEKGYADGNVRMFVKEENMFIFGDEGFYNGLNKNADIFGNSLLVRPMGEDTLFLAADTLIARDDSLSNERFLKAYYNVRIFKGDLQGICDSLFYDLKDSTFAFHDDPVLWSGDNQLSADFIKAQMKDKKIHRLDMTAKAFVVSENYFSEYNQIKGRDMTAFFEDGNVDSVYVEGNGESIYFMIDEQKGVLQGLNSIQCSNMAISFADSNRISTIDFLVNPVGKVYPPRLITHENKRLDNFAWHAAERPVRDSLLDGRTINTNVKVSHAPKGETLSENSEVFEIRLDGNKLHFYASAPRPEDLEGIFFVYVKPVTLTDMPMESQAFGLERVEFRLSEADISKKHGGLTKTVLLPSYPILRLDFGQRIPRKGNKWVGKYYFID
ncbi:MAG: OstA-like protein [Bacteroidota bacterium]